MDSIERRRVTDDGQRHSLQSALLWQHLSTHGRGKGSCQYGAFMDNPILLISFYLSIFQQHCRRVVDHKGKWGLCDVCWREYTCDCAITAAEVCCKHIHYVHILRTVAQGGDFMDPYVVMHIFIGSLIG